MTVYRKTRRRSKPVSPEALERMRAADAEFIWTAKCRVCGAELKGTLAQLKEHTHGTPPGPDPEPA